MRKFIRAGFCEGCTCEDKVKCFTLPRKTLWLCHEQLEKEDARKEKVGDVMAARQCLNLKRVCRNKSCLNLYCPLNTFWEKKKKRNK